MKFNLQYLYGWYGKAIRNPKYRWWVILGTLIYLLSPIDISPEVFPIVGQIDDFLVLTIMLSEVSQIMIDNFTRKKEELANASSDKTVKTVDVDAVSVE